MIEMKKNMSKYKGRARSMNNQQVILLIINIVGGAAVIGSYIFGLRSQAGGATVLWGGVPANIRSLIGVSMILAAVGYLYFLYYLLPRA